MNWDEFWLNQLRKNESGTAKFRVDTDPESLDEEFMCQWIEKWQEHFSYFDNSGCGCCINLYEFDAPQEAIAEIPGDIIMLKI